MRQRKEGVELSISLQQGVAMNVYAQRQQGPAPEKEENRRAGRGREGRTWFRGQNETKLMCAVGRDQVTDEGFISPMPDLIT